MVGGGGGVGCGSDEVIISFRKLQLSNLHGTLIANCSRPS